MLNYRSREKTILSTLKTKESQTDFYPEGCGAEKKATWQRLIFSVKVVIKTAEASIECKGLHDLDELDWSKLFSFAGEGLGRRGRGQGERDRERLMERQREREKSIVSFLSAFGKCWEP